MNALSPSPVNALAMIAGHADEPTCNLHWIGKQLGWDFARRSSAMLEDYVSGLIDFHGFPRPLPHRAHGGAICKGVSYPRSAWIRVGVLQWLANFLPPEAGAAITAAHEAAAAAEMDRAACHLHLVTGSNAA